MVEYEDSVKSVEVAHFKDGSILMTETVVFKEKQAFTRENMKKVLRDRMIRTGYNYTVRHKKLFGGYLFLDGEM